MNINKNIKDLVQKLFKGNISSEELNELNSWYDSFNNQDEINIPSLLNENGEIIKQRILQKIKSNRKQPKQFYSFVQQYKNVAAIIISISVILGSLFIIFNSISNEEELVFNEIKVEDGQKKILTFSDNTRITINSGSYFKYPKKIGEKSFEVYLEGEAFFEITPNKDRKFIVNTANISTTVLGTKFNINAFNQDEETSVSLIEGKVKVESKTEEIENNSIVLKPLEKLIINDFGEIKINHVNIQEEIGWKDNIIIFSRKSLKHILKVLSRTYGVKFILTNSDYTDKEFTANFNKASLSTVVKSIKKLTNLNAHIEKDGIKQTIVFY